ncbi:MAG: hypothetical protein J5552_05185 [Prevotella sp.]|nr:hypothetical protein [Prevotella sp.]
MKKTCLLSMMLALAFLLAIAKDVHVVIKGSSTHIPIGGTIVTATIDTLSVFPGVGVDTITVALCDMRGEVLESHSVPANFNDHVFVISPTLPDGCYIEVRDDKGVIYTQEE